MSRRRRGRPRGPLPDGIGEYPDDTVAAMSTANGRPLTRQAVFALRSRRGIPPAPVERRRRNQYDDAAE